MSTGGPTVDLSGYQMPTLSNTTVIKNIIGRRPKGSTGSTDDVTITSPEEFKAAIAGSEAKFDDFKMGKVIELGGEEYFQIMGDPDKRGELIQVAIDNAVAAGFVDPTVSGGPTGHGPKSGPVTGPGPVIRGPTVSGDPTGDSAEVAVKKAADAAVAAKVVVSEAKIKLGELYETILTKDKKYYIANKDTLIGEINNFSDITTKARTTAETAKTDAAMDADKTEVDDKAIDASIVAIEDAEADVTMCIDSANAANTAAESAYDITPDPPSPVKPTTSDEDKVVKYASEVAAYVIYYARDIFSNAAKVSEYDAAANAAAAPAADAAAAATAATAAQTAATAAKKSLESATKSHGIIEGLDIDLTSLGAAANADKKLSVANNKDVVNKFKELGEEHYKSATTAAAAAATSASAAAAGSASRIRRGSMGGSRKLKSRKGKARGRNRPASSKGKKRTVSKKRGPTVRKRRRTVKRN
jgi:hypothetical protein